MAGEELISIFHNQLRICSEENTSLLECVLLWNISEQNTLFFMLTYY